MHTTTFLRYYREYRNTIYTYFLYRVNFDRDLSEDLTEDVFLRAFEARNRFDNTKPFKPWIYRIAHNCLVNHYRDNGSKHTFSIEDVPDSTLTYHDEERLIGALDADSLLLLLDKLSDTDQYVLQLRLIDELSYSEMAEIFNKKEGAIRTAVSRAMQHFRECIQTHIQATATQ